MTVVRPDCPLHGEPCDDFERFLAHVERARCGAGSDRRVLARGIHVPSVRETLGAVRARRESSLRPETALAEVPCIHEARRETTRCWKCAR